MARELSYGPHTLVARARDEAKNVSTARVTVVHVGGGAYKIAIRTRVKLKVSPVSGGKVTVRGKVLPKIDVGKVLGMVSLYFERHDGKRWVRFGLYRKNASRPFRVTHRVVKGGKWRVRAKHTPKTGLAGVRASRARAPLTF